MPKITKSSDVFSSLNDFLSKDDESFSFSSENETPLSQAETQSDSDLEIVEKDVVPDSTKIVDLSKIDYNFIPAAKNKAIKKRTIHKTQSFLINDEVTIVDVVPPKKRRLKKAEVCSKLSSDDDITKDEENLIPITRSGKLRVSSTNKKKQKAKPPKTFNRELSLEEAMALFVEPITVIEPPIVPPPPRAKRGRPSKSKVTPVSPDVDLTGGATPPHSTSPLFQPRNEYIEPNYDSFDIDSVNIKLKLDGKIEIHAIRQHQKFLEIFKAVADAHNISINDVLIYNDSKRIHYDDTPHSIAYRASIFLTCRIMEKSGTVDSIETFRRCRNENEIEIKVQSDKWSRPLKIKISKVEKFKVALDILAESVEFKVEQMRLIFDGEKIDINDTPLELEFEGGEIVDCKIID